MIHADDLLLAAKIVSASAAGLPKSLGGDNEALAARLRAAAEARRWIPVGEGLPEVGSRVLVLVRVIWSIETAKFREDKRGKFWRIANTRVTMESVTHWMTLPAAPARKAAP